MPTARPCRALSSCTRTFRLLERVLERGEPGEHGTTVWWSGPTDARASLGSELVEEQLERGDGARVLARVSQAGGGAKDNRIVSRALRELLTESYNPSPILPETFPVLL